VLLRLAYLVVTNAAAIPRLVPTSDRGSTTAKSSPGRADLLNRFQQTDSRYVPGHYPGVPFTPVERHRLMTLLAGPGEANEVCRDALDNGAAFTITTAASPASHFVPIYRRRERHCRREGIATLGFDQAVERLEAAQDQPVRLGWVHVTEPPYYFQLFLADDLSTVLSCIGVDQAQQERWPSGRVTDPTA
jgi:hypothetical protein